MNAMHAQRKYLCARAEPPTARPAPQTEADLDRICTDRESELRSNLGIYVPYHIVVNMYNFSICGVFAFVFLVVNRILGTTIVTFNKDTQEKICSQNRYHNKNKDLGLTNPNRSNENPAAPIRSTALISIILLSRIPSDL